LEVILALGFVNNLVLANLVLALGTDGGDLVLGFTLLLELTG
jgi:hypothetical protein